MPSPLPAKKSTKLGAGGFMSAVEEIEGGVSNRHFGKWEDVALRELIQVMNGLSLCHAGAWMRWA